MKGVQIRSDRGVWIVGIVQKGNNLEIRDQICNLLPNSVRVVRDVSIQSQGTLHTLRPGTVSLK